MNQYLLTVSQMTKGNVKARACCDEPEKECLTQFCNFMELSSLFQLIVSFKPSMCNLQITKLKSQIFFTGVDVD